MDDSLRLRLEPLLDRLDELSREGRRSREVLAGDPADGRALAAMAEWQRQCASLIGQLSGGSKAHWLARAYSQAFFPDPSAGAVAVEAGVAEILDRILKVLDQARQSLQQAEAGAAQAADHQGRSIRFEFVADPVLRAHLEGVYAESRAAAARGERVLAFVAACSALEAIITEALRRGRPAGGAAADVASWSFPERIERAQAAGLISAGCVRLPDSARRYRELLDPAGEIRPDATISEREIRLVGQVLHVIVRDLTPGR